MRIYYGNNTNKTRKVVGGGVSIFFALLAIFVVVRFEPTIFWEFVVVGSLILSFLIIYSWIRNNYAKGVWMTAMVFILLMTFRLGLFQWWMLGVWLSVMGLLFWKRRV